MRGNNEQEKKKGTRYQLEDSGRGDGLVDSEIVEKKHPTEVEKATD